MSTQNRPSTLSRPHTRRRPVLESLEDRQLMSLASEFGINAVTSNESFDSDNAKSGNGASVVVWTDFSSSANKVIRAQRLGFEGIKNGPEIVVASLGSGDFSAIRPKVAMNSLGEFVVTWTQPSGSDTNVLARRFNAAGLPIGGVVQVGVGTFKEHDPDVAFGNTGNFVVAYTRDTNNVNPDVFAKQYSFSTGQLINVINVATTSKGESLPSVAVHGNVINVAYQLAFSGSDDDVKLARFSTNGTALGTVTVAGAGVRERAPSLGLDGLGNAFVAYQRIGGDDWDVKVRRVSTAGSVGPEINIQNTGADETRPSIAVRRSAAGGFVVAYNSDDRVKVTEVTDAGVVKSTSDAGDGRTNPAVSIDGNGEYLVTYTRKTRPFPFLFQHKNVKGRIGRLFF
ncbi:MAG: hypothetical protein AB7I30_12320 [Isosphaeraceae bacterium]